MLVGAAHPAFEYAEVAFDSIRRNQLFLAVFGLFVARIFLRSVINAVVFGHRAARSPVKRCFIGMQRALAIRMAHEDLHDGRAVDPINMHRASTTAALHQRHDCLFAALYALHPANAINEQPIVFGV